MFRPLENPKNNCVAISDYYYISSYNQYKTLEIYQCPEIAKFKIKEKKACIDNCTKDNEYKYLYNGDCLKECPSDTTSVNYICEENSDKCSKGEDDLYLYNNNLDAVEILAKSYASEFSYTNNHISSYKNDNYSIIIYKNAHCIKELALEMPNIDFESCYKKVQEYYGIEENLIVTIAERKLINNPLTFFSFFHPESGEKLDAGKICEGEKVVIEENLYELLNKNNTNYKTQTFLTDQGINIFDKNHPFYNDLCYDYENLLKKDIPLSCRIKDIFPNASVCDEGCTYESINLEDMTSKCNCDFNDLANNNFIKENEILNSVMGEVFDIINSTNILVLKCIKYMFKRFATSIGGWISLIVICAEAAMIVIYYLIDFNKVKIYIMKLTERFIEYIAKGGIIIKHNPPRKPHSIKNNKNSINNNNIKVDKYRDDTAIKVFEHKKMVSRNEDVNRLTFYNSQKEFTLVSKFNKDIPKKDYMETEKNESKFFEEYFKESVDDMEYDDALYYDKRIFCELFKEYLKEKQITAATFIAEDDLNPRSIKIIVFIINFLLYFVVNGLFFSEEVIQELYELDESKEHFFSYFSRSITRIVYCALVGIVIGYIVELFFIKEDKLKGILIREKDNEIVLKEKIVEFIKEIKKTNLALMIVSGIIILFSFIYLLCFNYVYKYSQIEWIKSSITIVIIMQLLSILKCFAKAGLRTLSFKWRSEKLYKISKLLD